MRFVQVANAMPDDSKLRCESLFGSRDHFRDWPMTRLTNVACGAMVLAYLRRLSAYGFIAEHVWCRCEVMSGQV